MGLGVDFSVCLGWMFCYLVSICSLVFLSVTYGSHPKLGPGNLAVYLAFVPARSISPSLTEKREEGRELGDSMKGIPREWGRSVVGDLY